MFVPEGSWGRGGQMAALCARFQYLTGPYFTLQSCALCSRAARSLPGGRPVPAWGWQMLQPGVQTTNRASSLCHSRCVCKSPQPGSCTPCWTLYRNVIYLGRPLGHINPSSSRGRWPLVIRRLNILCCNNSLVISRLNTLCSNKVPNESAHFHTLPDSSEL